MRVSHFWKAQKSFFSKKTFITTPIFYVNAEPHIGHLYSMVLADVAHRFSKLNNIPSILSTGTDEHGTKVSRAAELAHTPPQQFVDDLSRKFRRLADLAKIDYTRFIRTSDSDHIAEATSLWQNLEICGYIYKSKHAGWYCVNDETFYPETELIFDKVKNEKLSKESGNTVEWCEEENWFFKLSALQQPLIDLFEANPSFVLPKARHKSLLAELKSQPLQDLSISRPLERCSWGIPVPKSDHTMYVWFEALVNYLTVARSQCYSSQLNWWPATHIIGKDIVRFHAIYWPAFLIAANMEPPKQVVVHSHWTFEGTKMSKSKKNVVDPIESIAKYGLDTVRYMLCHDSTLAHDCPFSYDRLMERHNVNLVNKWSNLVSRVCGPKFDISKSIEHYRRYLTKHSFNNSEASALLNQCMSLVQNFEFGRYAQVVNKFAIDANIAFQEAEPWVSPDSEASIIAVGRAAEQCRVISLMLQPICPSYAAAMLDRLGVKQENRMLHFARSGLDTDYGKGANYKGGHVLKRFRLE